MIGTLPAIDETELPGVTPSMDLKGKKISGDKGIIWRNKLAWNLLSHGKELYWALDYGRVDGPGTRYLAEHHLAGGALGLWGALGKCLRFDFFAGVPLVKPDKFPTSGLTSGFSINVEL